MEQVRKGWLDGPYPFDTGGQLLAGDDPQIAETAFRFGTPQGEKLRTGGEFKKRPNKPRSSFPYSGDTANGGSFRSSDRNFSVRGNRRRPCYG